MIESDKKGLFDLMVANEDALSFDYDRNIIASFIETEKKYMKLDFTYSFFLVTDDEPYILNFNSLGKYLIRLSYFLVGCIYFDKKLYDKIINYLNRDFMKTLTIVILKTQSGSVKREDITRVYISYFNNNLNQLKSVKLVCQSYYEYQKKELYKKRKDSYTIKIYASDKQSSYAHKEILIFESDYFYKVLRYGIGFKELETTDELTIDLNLNELEVMLKFIYLGVLETTSFLDMVGLLSKIQPYDEFKLEDALIKKIIEDGIKLIKVNPVKFEKVIKEAFKEYKIEKATQSLFKRKWKDVLEEEKIYDFRFEGIWV
jgi:hypothetical protein